MTSKKPIPNPHATAGKAPSMQLEGTISREQQHIRWKKKRKSGYTYRHLTGKPRESESQRCDRHSFIAPWEYLVTMQRHCLLRGLAKHCRSSLEHGIQTQRGNAVGIVGVSHSHAHPTSMQYLLVLSMCNSLFSEIYYWYDWYGIYGSLLPTPMVPISTNTIDTLPV